MRSSFDKAFELTIGLEGKPTNDPSDPGGFTIWGLAKKYHPEIDENTTIEHAKQVYLEQYWIPSQCDDASYPFDCCLFDSAVNPQGHGNKELMDKNPESWQAYNIYRMIRYMKNSKPEYVKGHIFRVLRLSEALSNYDSPIGNAH